MCNHDKQTKKNIRLHTKQTQGTRKTPIWNRYNKRNAKKIWRTLFPPNCDNNDNNDIDTNNSTNNSNSNNNINNSSHNNNNN